MKEIRLPHVYYLLLWIALCALPGFMLHAQPASTLKNGQYHLSLQKDGTILLQNRDGAHAAFQPRFTILYRADNPGLWRFKDTSTNFYIPRWTKLGKKNLTIVQYEAARNISTKAIAYKITGDTIRWTFPSDTLFDLSATVLLEVGEVEPKVSFHFMPKKEGWYSIGYTGAPEVNPDNIESIWQPLVWQERRFPAYAVLSMEQMCPLPAVLLGEKGATTSVIADPAEVPFRLPVFDNARFGLSIRNEKGNAQPTIFAPVFGQKDSKMKPDEQYDFSFRLLSQKGSWLDTYRYIARSIYHFHDYRENATASLNETLENMIDLAMNDTYSGWNSELKAFDYSTDVKNTVKLVSALHPLSLALITDNPEIYNRRALPMMEYLISREKFLFSLKEGETNQSPSHLMKGPAAGVSEFSALFSISQNRSPVFAHLALSLFDKQRISNLGMITDAGRWQDALALYRMTGNKEFLDKATTKALAYIKRRIDTPQTDFSDAHLGKGRSLDQGGQFWTDFSPQWMDLLELYETTKDQRFLDAAWYAAKIYTSYVWLQPAVPPGEILINSNGTVAMGDVNKPNPKPMAAMPLQVPAWRVSQIGLTPEASNTYDENPAVFLTTYAAYMMRLAHYTGDGFLKDIARSAVVGRYTNYPGYDINREYTTIYQRPDYPLRDWNTITYNQMYYNHIWPHIALIMDYLIADALYRSDGNISFPSHNAEGYVYLHTKVYGDKPGNFYEDKNVRLWMPKGLLRSDNIQVNYIAGYGNDNIYLALMNQSDSAVKVKLALNQDIVPVDLQKKYTVSIWKENKKSPDIILSNGELTVAVKEKGLTALRIENIPVKTRFQELVADSLAKPLSENSYGALQTDFGKITGMLISMGRSLTEGYIWLDATERTLRKATLYYRTGGEWKTITDNIYPYEFSIPLDDKDETLECRVEGETPEGKIIGSGNMRLKK